MKLKLRSVLRFTTVPIKVLLAVTIDALVISYQIITNRVSNSDLSGGFHLKRGA